MPKRTAEQTAARRARSDTQKRARAAANESRHMSNRADADALGLSRDQVVVRRVPSGRPGQFREVTVVKPVRPSKLLRSDRRARERIAEELRKLAAVRAVATATVAREATEPQP